MAWDAVRALSGDGASSQTALILCGQRAAKTQPRSATVAIPLKAGSDAGSSSAAEASNISVRELDKELPSQGEPSWEKASPQFPG
jgi:hypothetical protein